ncbi:MAG: TlpA family protein disulfide reductase [Prevotellaceae bacterium]|jgi:thiol-disulfide isomerase/thioredoxin|nr:TlpA family protein disulfide reductase [Prevotellaceae bacterium]
MKTNTVALIALLLSTITFSCSQEKIVELPLTMQIGYAPFPMWLGGTSHHPENEDNPWKNTYLKVSKFPEGLSGMRYGDIETNIYQTVYQEYMSGNITKDFYEELQKSWNWIPDTLNLSKTPVKTKIAFAYGKDSAGILKIVVDANNNLDLTDDELFIPFEMESVDNNANKDSLALAHVINVSFEIFVHDKTVPVNVPIYIEYSRRSNIFFYNLSQYATSQFKGEQIAVVSSGFMNLSYKDIEVAFMRNDLKNGEKIKEENRYRKNEYIEIKNEIYRIAGVNTNKSTLTLERMGLSREQLFSTQIGYKSYLFQEEEFTTKSSISLDSLKGKYVVLDFWATWCGPCIQELPHLKELYSKTDRAKFEIVGIVGSSRSNTLTEAIDKHAITWPQILSDDTNKITEMYGINGYPTTFLIDTEGIVIAKNLRGNELEEKVLSLLR